MNGGVGYDDDGDGEVAVMVVLAAVGQQPERRGEGKARVEESEYDEREAQRTIKNDHEILTPSPEFRYHKVSHLEKGLDSGLGLNCLEKLHVMIYEMRKIGSAQTEDADPQEGSPCDIMKIASRLGQSIYGNVFSLFLMLRQAVFSFRMS
ncbi:hypothetical protein Tco_0516875 [Tanacetum coccineum]